MTSRSAALHHLSNFLERVPHYASQRNFDRPGHAEVSCLSKWIRYRVITEEECVAAVFARHPFEVAEKFVQEVLWRTYWKGWLELRPQVWRSFRAGVERFNDEGFPEGYLQAIEGRTGLSFFDEWVQELRLTGYLHNHTRMWFASVWIFTLRLPWQLGADFMYRHLLDGDPASNTLSWRWVGGLQTPGKIYVARPDNIEKYSEGRWRPKESELNLNPTPLRMDDIGAIVPLEPLSADLPRPGDSVLVHDDDLSVDLSQEFSSTGLAFLMWTPICGEGSPLVLSHQEGLRRDAVERMGAAYVNDAEAIIQEMKRGPSRRLHVMLPPCGEVRSDFDRLAEVLSSHGVEVLLHRRRWDSLYFPFAKSGFFPFWSAVKRRLERES
jgi:deoxyribodipyrimidine photo-lyase